MRTNYEAVINKLVESGVISTEDNLIKTHNKVVLYLYQLLNEHNEMKTIARRVIEYQQSMIAKLQNEVWSNATQNNLQNEVARKEQVIQDKDKKATRLIEIIREKNRIIDGLGAGEESEDSSGINGMWREVCNGRVKAVNSRAEEFRKALGVRV